eukprot:361194_1
MATFNSFFSPYLEQSSVMSVSMTLTTLIFWIFLLLLTCYTLNHIFCKKEDLQTRVKLFTVLSTVSFKSYIGIIILSMLFYQFKMMQKYTYSIAISYIFLAIGKQSMYFLFLHTLYITFKRSKYQISSIINKFVMSLIVINFLIYLLQPYFWIEYRRNGQLEWIWHLQLSTIPIEMFYSFFIVGLFSRRLFMINLARINEQKTQKYEHRVRAATSDIIQQHKQKLKLQRSLSCDDVEDEDELDFTEETSPTNTQQSVPSPRSVSFNVPFKSNNNRNSTKTTKTVTFHANTSQNNSPIDTTLSLRKTPSLRQRKSMNIHRFNKENKELLDKHQLSMIDTAAKYTVLSSIAFVTSLTCTTCIGIAEIMYNANKNRIDAYVDYKFNFDFIVLCIFGMNGIISDICVLLRYNDILLTKIYHILCCCCSICCRHCFMYCSIRRIMTTVEDKLAQEVEAECDAIHNENNIMNKQLDLETELSVHHNNNDSKNSITSTNTNTNTNNGIKIPILNNLSINSINNNNNVHKLQNINSNSLTFTQLSNNTNTPITPNTPNSIITSFNRNFAKRND